MRVAPAPPDWNESRRAGLSCAAMVFSFDSAETADSGSDAEESGGRPAEHGDAAHLLVEERHDRSDTAVEFLDDSPHVVVLHPESVTHELWNVRPQGVTV